MARAKVGTVVRSGSSQTVSVGFAPSAVLFWATGAAAASGTADGVAASFGAATLADQACAAWGSANGKGKSAVGQALRTDCAVWLQRGKDWEATGVVSLGESGFVVAWTAAVGAPGHAVHWLALGGVQAQIVTFSFGPGLADQSIPFPAGAAPFAVTAGLFGGVSTFASSSGSSRGLSVGVWDGAYGRAQSFGVAAVDAKGTTVTHRCAGKWGQRTVLAVPSDMTAPPGNPILGWPQRYPASLIGSALASGSVAARYTLWDGADLSGFGLLLGGVHAVSDAHTVPVYGGASMWLETGFSPVAAVGLYHDAADVSPVNPDVSQARLGVGFGDGTDQRFGHLRDRHNVGTTQTQAAHRTDFLARMDGNDATASCVAPTVTFSGTNCVVNWGAVDGVAAAEYGLLVLGEVPVELAGTATGGSAAGAALSTGPKAAGSAVGGSVATADRLRPAHPVAGTATGTAAASAAMRTGAALAGAAAGTAAASAGLAAVNRISGATGGTSSAEASSLLRPTVALSATVVGGSLAEGWVGRKAWLAGEAAAGSAVPAARLALAVRLAGSAAAGEVEHAAGSLALAAGLAGLAAGAGGAAGQIGWTAELWGEAAGGSLASAARLRLDRPLAGTARGWAEASVWEAWPWPAVEPAGEGEYPGTVNLVRNASLEWPGAGLTDWGADGGTLLEAVWEVAWHGERSARATVPPAGGTVWVATQRGLGLDGGSWVGSVRLRGEGAFGEDEVTVGLVAVLADGTEVVPAYAEGDGPAAADWAQAGADGWLLAVAEPVAAAAGGSPVDHLRLEVAVAASAGEDDRLLWLDGAQVEADAGQRGTTFADGDMGPLYGWSGAAGLSPAWRQPQAYTR